MKNYKERMKISVIRRGGFRWTICLKKLRVLKPHHAENFLCIFEGLFKQQRESSHWRTMLLMLR